MAVYWQYRDDWRILPKKSYIPAKVAGYCWMKKYPSGIGYFPTKRFESKEEMMLFFAVNGYDESEIKELTEEEATGI